ncbi:MAG: hypothetical protein KC635_12215 [Myxococcales bacterium]|nr:hypothetical protein [Myxococcales bacterium]MCB9736132.1 hypothetical protein [Deltaproteobacteria bacterium]
MNAVSLTVCALLGLAVAACSSTTPATSKDSAEAATAPAPTEEMPESAAAPGEVSYEGTLHYKELPATKSVEAYMGVDLTLDRGDDQAPLPLTGSDVWPHDRLVALDGKRVSLACVMKEATPPRPDEQYPTDMDGKPLQRPAKCAVLRVVEQ